MTRTLGCFTLMALMAAGASAAPPQFRYTKPIEFPAIDGEELVSVALDGEVYAATSDGLPDLRIIDDQNDEVAFITRLAGAKRTRTDRRTWTVENPTVRPLDDDALEITFELDRSQQSPPTDLRLISPLSDFEHRVQVFSAASGADWEPLVEEGLIFDYDRFIDARNDSIALPATAHRRFRILIENVTDEQQSQLLELTRRLEDGDETNRSEQTTIDRRPFRIDRIELSSEVTRAAVSGAREMSYAIEKFTIGEDPSTKQTLITVESRREPLTELTIETPDRNFSRRAAVAIDRRRNGRQGWRTIGGGQIAHLDFRSLQRSDLTLSFAETRQARYRIVIDNLDSPPLKITGVKARGHVYEVIFLASPGRKYTLAYGNDAVEDPNYDTAVLSATLSEGFEPIAATLGKESAGKSTPAPALSRFTQLLNDGRFVTATIAALVLLLGFALYRATQRLDKQPNNPL